MGEKVPLRQLQAKLKERIREDRKLIQAAALDTAAWGIQRAVALTDADGLVDRGQYKAAWKFGKTARSAYIANNSPIAGVIEHGRRPGAKPPPLGPILAWVRRHRLGAQFGHGTGKRLKTGALRGQKAREMQIARAIQIAIGKRGLRPHFILRRVMAEAGPRFKAAATAALRNRHL